MKTDYQRSQKLNSGFRIMSFEAADLVNAFATPKGADSITECVNADRRQKVALVEARADLSEMIEGLGFKRAVKETVKKGEKDVEILITEGDHIDQFRTALNANSFTIPTELVADHKPVFNIPAFTPQSTTEAQKTAVETFLQALADQCGDRDETTGAYITNPPSYVLNLERTEAKERTNGKLPKYATDGAESILKGGADRIAFWKDRFTNGYTNTAGIVIDPIPFEDFGSPKGDNETVEQQTARNVKRLAVCIVAVKKQEIAKTQSEFA